MEKNHLLIIDLEKNLDLTFYNKNYVYLNRGNINLKNCKQIRLKNFSNSRKVFIKNYCSRGSVRHLTSYLSINSVAPTKFAIAETVIPASNTIPSSGILNENTSPSGQSP